MTGYLPPLFSTGFVFWVFFESSSHNGIWSSLFFLPRLTGQQAPKDLGLQACTTRPGSSCGLLGLELVPYTCKKCFANGTISPIGITVYWHLHGHEGLEFGPCMLVKRESEPPILLHTCSEHILHSWNKNMSYLTCFSYSLYRY